MTFLSEDEAIVAFLRHAASYSVTVQLEAWNEAQHEWMPEYRVADPKAERRWLCHWGAKLGHFTTGETLLECITRAAAKFAVGMRAPLDSAPSPR